MASEQVGRRGRARRMLCGRCDTALAHAGLARGPADRLARDIAGGALHAAQRHKGAAVARRGRAGARRAADGDGRTGAAGHAPPKRPRARCGGGRPLRAPHAMDTARPGGRAGRPPPPPPARPPARSLATLDAALLILSSALPPPTSHPHLASDGPRPDRTPVARPGARSSPPPPPPNHALHRAFNPPPLNSTHSSPPIPTPTIVDAKGPSLNLAPRVSFLAS